MKYALTEERVWKSATNDEAPGRMREPQDERDV